MRRGIVAITLIATTLISPASVHASTDSASALVPVPAAQSATKGSVVSLAVQVAGASGGQEISYVVVGRNDGVHGSVTTGDDGSATLSYRDHGTAISATSDTIALIGAAQDEFATATVDFLDGPDYADTVALDASGLGVDDESCGQNAASPVQIPIAGVTAVCAEVTNALGEPLAGRAVTFAVSFGSVGPASGGVTPGAVPTYQAITDRSGIAFAAVTATTPGVQQILAGADHMSGTATVDYAAPVPSDSAKISVVPSSATIGAGRHLRLAMKVVDAYGNPVAGVPVSFQLSGPGKLSTVAAETPITGTSGLTRIAVATSASDRGPGSLTATIATSPALCVMSGSCSATASYVVTKPIVPASLTLAAAPGARLGTVELVAAIVKGSDGSAEPGQLVHFVVSGVDAAAGAVRTNRKGVALFGYPAQRAGADLVQAWDDVSRDGVRQTREPAGSLRLVVAGRARK
jgi:hypothetical protein